MTQLACPSEYVALAHSLADSARPIIRKHFRTRLDIVSKTDDSPVTIADRTAEMAMRKLVSTKFPDHGIRGVVTDWNGNSLGDEQHFDTVLMAANPTLHAVALELLQRHQGR